MNLLIGESHVSFAVGHDPQTPRTMFPEEKIFFYEGYQHGQQIWQGYSYHRGLKTFEASNQVDKDLSAAGISLSNYDNVVLILGTNETAFHVRNSRPYAEYLHNYVDYVEQLRLRNNLQRIFIATPFYAHHNVRGYGRWSGPDWEPLFKSTDERDASVREFTDAVIHEAQRYDNVHIIKLLDIFNEDGELFNSRYSLDGMHFNELGRQKFFEVISSAMS